MFLKLERPKMVDFGRRQFFGYKGKTIFHILKKVLGKISNF